MTSRRRNDAVSALVDFHLADPVGDGWFTIPSSIRAYALEALDAGEAQESARSSVCSPTA